METEKETGIEELSDSKIDFVIPEPIDLILYDETVSSFNKFIGISLLRLSSYSTIIRYIYYLILSNCGILSLILIICNISNNSLWNSSIIRSDSQYYLLSAYIFLMYSYGLNSFFNLRICLSFACICFMLFGAYGIPGFFQFDTIIWNLFMLLINIKQLILMKYDQRYIPFDPHFEQLYLNIFKPYLSRHQFQKLVHIGYVRRIPQNTIMRQEGTEIIELAYLVKGRVDVLRNSNNDNKYDESSLFDESIQNSIRKGCKRRRSLARLNEIEFDTITTKCNQVINTYHSNEFIDGSQWIGHDLRPNNFRCVYETAVKSRSHCIYIGWSRDPLIELLDKDTAIRQAVLNAVGICTARQYIRQKRLVKGRAALTDVLLEEAPNKPELLRAFSL